jgi:hypothetical protein
VQLCFGGKTQTRVSEQSAEERRDEGTEEDVTYSNEELVNYIWRDYTGVISFMGEAE